MPIPTITNRSRLVGAGSVPHALQFNEVEDSKACVLRLSCILAISAIRSCRHHGSAAVLTALNPAAFPAASVGSANPPTVHVRVDKKRQTTGSRYKTEGAF